MLRVVYHHRDTIPAVVIVINGTKSLAAVVGGDDEKGVVEPRLFACFFEETSYRVVCVFHAFQQRMSAFNESFFVLFRDGVGVVRTDGEDFGKEGGVI